MLAEWYSYRPLGVRENPGEYGPGSDKGGSVDQIGAVKGLVGHRCERDVFGTKPSANGGVHDGYPVADRSWDLQHKGFETIARNTKPNG